MAEDRKVVAALIEACSSQLGERNVPEDLRLGNTAHLSDRTSSFAALGCRKHLIDPWIKHTFPTIVISLVGGVAYQNYR